MINQQVLVLQEEYEKMQAYLEGLPAEVYERNLEIYQARLKELDQQIDDLLMSPEERAKRAMCLACTVAPAMRVCRVCAFGEYAHLHRDQLAIVGDWAADWPWANEDEEDLRGLYAYGI